MKINAKECETITRALGQIKHTLRNFFFVKNKYFNFFSIEEANYT